MEFIKAMGITRSGFGSPPGPVLLALTGGFAETEIPRLTFSPEELEGNLIPRGELEFAVKDNPAYRIIPYYAVRDEVFTCFPVMG
jgi:hypothetical protein